VDLSCRQIWRAWSATADGLPAVVAISAAEEGLGILTTSAVVIPTLGVMLSGAQRPLDNDYRAAAAELRGSTHQVESFAEANGVPSAEPLRREENPAAPGSAVAPVLSDGKK